MVRIIKYEAVWCGPCRAIAPQVAQVAQDTGAELVPVDCDEQPERAQAAGVQSLPTIVVQDSQGQEVARFMGTPPGLMANLRAAIRQAS